MQNESREFTEWKARLAFRDVCSAKMKRVPVSRPRKMHLHRPPSVLSTEGTTDSSVSMEKYES